VDIKITTWGDLKELIDPIQWDWPGWLPRGFVTILASEPGMGKSLLCLRLAASYVSGADWPDGTPFTGEQGRVVWCEGEASQALNLARAEKWRLELSKFVSPLSDLMYSFKMDNRTHLTSLAILSRWPGTQLIVLDSLSSLQRESQIYTTLANLSDLARISGVPVLLTHHLRKRTSYDRDGRIDQERLRGTSRIAQSARVVWSLDAPDISDPTHRRLAVVKNNLMPAAEPLGMRIQDEGLVFGPAPVVIDEAVSQLDVAADLLFDLLGNGPRSFEEVQEACLAAGVAKRTMERAKRRLGIVSFRQEGEMRWYWKLGERGD
jgi:putative DNA primase/helicase